MANKTKNMQQIRLILQLLSDGRSQRSIARQVSVSRPTIQEYFKRSQAIGLDLSNLSAYDDAMLSALLLPEAIIGTDLARYEALRARLPQMRKEITKVGVTRLLLWEEYSKAVTNPYGYTQFCQYFNQDQIKKNAIMHFAHKAGECVMIDFAGKLLSYSDPKTGLEEECQVFVAILPSSSYTYVKAIPSQRLEDFIGAIASMFNYFGGVPQKAIIDNLKSGVTKPDRYEPKLTDMLEQLSAHYGCVFMAARPYKPRDKAAVEAAVKQTYISIYAPLRNQAFHSLGELNEAILNQLEIQNNKPFQRDTTQTRFSLFTEIEQQSLRSLPPDSFVLKYTAEYKVQFNYHIILGCDKHYYSVPYKHIGERLQVVYTHETVEIYAKSKRIAFHMRNRTLNGYTTLYEHMPPNHQHHLTIQKYIGPDFLGEAQKIGPHCVQICEHLLNARQFKEQAYNSCLGLVRLAPKYTAARVELACQRALRATTPNYQCVKNILQNNLDTQESSDSPGLSQTLITHENLRGAEAFL